jgi:carboxylesterase type B
MFTLIFSVLCIGAVLAEQPSTFSTPIIQTRSGAVQGVELRSGLFSRYYGFNGIPYAQPPVGDLRFRAPVPHGGWDGVRNAADHGSVCPSSSFLGEYSGNEDCLFLNVYTPNLLGRKAVMVWFHGGSFTGGSGDSFIYGPDHLIQQDVLVVTINYRLGILGFMSTGDRHSSGNFGLKDSILALQWIKDNILAFGGDPDNITIFGQSAGGALVHYLVLSPLANGLYSKAISQSGSALLPWAFQPDPARWAFHTGEQLGFFTDSTEELVARLKQATALELVNATPGWLSLEIPRGFSSMAFVPSVDSPDSDEPRVITDLPRNLMARGEFNKIPYMHGYTDAESLFVIHEQSLDNGTIAALNADQHAWIPSEFNVPHGSADADQIVQEIKDFYLGGQDLSDDLRWEWSKYCTDRHFIHGIDETVKIHAEHQTQAVYYYVFTFTGSLNLIKNFLLLGSFPGAVHADEIPYMFSITGLSPPLLPTNHAFVIRRRLLRMFSNFAITSNPFSALSPDVQVQWPRVVNGGEFIDIGHDLTVGQCAMCDRTSLYYSWRDRFAR